MKSSNKINITAIFSLLVHPGKNLEEQPEIKGTSLLLKGNLFNMLFRQFEKALDECNIDIAFKAASDGSQNNQCRNEIIALIKNPTLLLTKTIAQRLQSVTTHRSELGLLFIIVGDNNNEKRIYISRFPADIGIIAEEQQSTLRVEFIEKVFMKNAQSYKAAVYEGNNLNSGFWTGKAIDKQINNKAIALSSYWIDGFLLSSFRTTTAQGTRRLALAIKATIDETEDMEIKEELCAAARLARSLDGQSITMENFAERFALSNKTQSAVISKLQDSSYQFDQFIFSAEEFSKHVRYRTIQINNGAILSAPINKFDDCFMKRRVEEKGKEYEFITRGTIVDESLRKKLK